MMISDSAGTHEGTFKGTRGLLKKPTAGLIAVCGG